VKPRVVLDTNIYISAILFGGRPEEVFLLVKEEEVDLYVSTAIIAEVAAKLTDKFHWSPADVTDVVKEIGETATVVRPRKRLYVIAGDESDNRVLECAIEAKAEFIVSGDRRHLLSLKQYDGIRIVSAAVFLRRIGKP
jgi:putative PIN family toxin of toxin-antitoxin system